MFEEKRVMFLYCVSPVHMGAGTALGAIDNPIQRERHTEHPMMAGSGLKGALRHEASTLWKKSDVTAVFGPDTQESGENEKAAGENDKAGRDQAGALSLSDAQIVLFPVRSLRGTFVYATCPTALGRLERLLLIAGAEGDAWSATELVVQGDECALANDELLSEGHLVLEAFRFKKKDDISEASKRVAEWFGRHAVPVKGHAYFREKIRTDTVVLSDDRFSYFVRNATVVEPHVRISDETGTAEARGLFYTECLPPECLLVCLSMASRERSSNGMEAGDVMDALIRGRNGAKGFGDRMIQVGGDATTGRGQVFLCFVSGAQEGSDV